MGTTNQRTALVVYESMFGNTAEIAEAVRRGLTLEGVDAHAVEVGTAPPAGDATVDLLVVGAPTHAFSLSRLKTREAAVDQGAPVEREARGLREWLDTLAPPPRPRLVAAFDTRHRRVRRLPLSAARAANRALRRAGHRPVVRPCGFLVEDLKGPVVEGELERAVQWGRSLARMTQDRLAADAARAHARSAGHDG
jgi:hypothetical protein